MSTRWDLPPTDARVRLAEALEAWADRGGIEVTHLDEMDQLIDELAAKGLAVEVREPATARRRLLAQMNGHTLADEGGEWRYACSCGAFATADSGSLSATKSRWRAHVIAAEATKESA